MAWDELREAIPALKDQIYLNTGVSGPPPQDAVEEEIAWVKRLALSGPGRPDVMAAAAERVEAVRAQVAAFLGAKPEEIVLNQSCSDGIALVASGLTWEPGDEVLVSDLEHISGLLPWYDLSRRQGVVVRSVPLRNGRLYMEDIDVAVTPRTKLICMSHVAYNTGARLPVEDAAELARKRGARLLVDGAQGPGHVDVDVKSLGCHFYACAGQKWMLGPDGTGALYVAEEQLEELTPTRVGWASVVHDDRPPSEFSFKPGAARFEIAGKSTPALAALGKGLERWQALGMAAVEARIRELVHAARDRLASVPGLEFVTPDDPSVWSGLIVFTLQGVSPDDAVNALWERERIVCRTIPQFDAVRVSIHAYNTFEEMDLLAEALRRIVSGR